VKKALSLILALTLILTLAPPLTGNTAYAAGDKQMQAAYAHTKPAINGVLEDSGVNPYANTETQITEVFKTELKGAVGRFRLLWDEGGLYVFTEVIDPFITTQNSMYWFRDSIDIILDQLNTKSTPHHASVARVVVDADGTVCLTSPSPGLQNAGFQSAAVLTDIGYNIERRDWR